MSKSDQLASGTLNVPVSFCHIAPSAGSRPWQTAVAYGGPPVRQRGHADGNCRPRRNRVGGLGRLCEWMPMIGGIGC